MKLSEMVPRLQIKAPMKATSMEAAFRELLRVVANIYTAMGQDEVEDLVDRLEEREQLASTVLDNGIAIPHVYHDRFRHLVAVFGRHPGGIAFAGEPTPLRGIFLLLVPEGRTELQMLALNKLSGLVQDEGFVQRLMTSADEEVIATLFDEVDQGKANGNVAEQ